jgi:hypothetical protein
VSAGDKNFPFIMDMGLLAVCCFQQMGNRPGRDLSYEKRLTRKCPHCAFKTSAPSREATQSDLVPALRKNIGAFHVGDRTDKLGSASHNPPMGQAERPTCPHCGAHLILALPPGKGRRTFQCFDCERPDPLKTDQATGWLQGELRPPE